jgi:hypothetical protein
MEPLTITTTCLGLINGIASLAQHITVFVNDVRGARKDMDMISRELTSLSLCLEALRTDCKSERVQYPKASRKCLEGALLNIDVVTQQVKDLLQRLSSGRLGRRIQWTMQSKDTVDRLRTSLETQKSTIEIALQCGSIQILCAIQRQVEKPAQDFTRLENTTQAIRDDTRELRREAVGIKQLIRQEADTLRVEISALRDSKPLSAGIEEFLRLSQDYSARVTNPFMTPEQSDAGHDDSLTETFSRSSLVLTPDSTADPFIAHGALEQGQHSSFTCPICGHRMVNPGDPAENIPDRSTGDAQQHRPEELTDKPEPDESPLTTPRTPSSARTMPLGHARRESILARRQRREEAKRVIDTTFICGNNSFNFTFPGNAEISEIQASFYKCLQEQEVKRVFWIPEIKKPEDIRFKFNDSEMIIYADERLSDLARVYGSGSALILESMFKPQGIPDFRPYIQIPHDRSISTGRGVPWVYPGSLGLLNRNNVRWHAPIAWRCTWFRRSNGSYSPATYKDGVRLKGGALQPGDNIKLDLTEAQQNEFSETDKLEFEAVLIKPGDSPHHWDRLILMTPETDRWKHVLTCRRGVNVFRFHSL